MPLKVPGPLFIILHWKNRLHNKKIGMTDFHVYVFIWNFLCPVLLFIFFPFAPSSLFGFFLYPMLLFIIFFWASMKYLLTYTPMLHNYASTQLHIYLHVHMPDYNISKAHFYIFYLLDICAPINICTCLAMTISNHTSTPLQCVGERSQFMTFCSFYCHSVYDEQHPHVWLDLLSWERFQFMMNSINMHRQTLFSSEWFVTQCTGERL